ncbi:MAG: BrnT family toxin [Pseudomonadota bacterium]
MEFEFDPAKSASNKEKHGLDFVEAQDLWADSRAIDLAVLSLGEPRRLVIGLIGARHWTAVWTPRGQTIRIISVRRSRKDEVQKWVDGP